jgi:hypothetical protein
LADRSFDLIARFVQVAWSRFDGTSGVVSRGEAVGDASLERCAAICNGLGNDPHRLDKSVGASDIGENYGRS